MDVNPDIYLLPDEDILCFDISVDHLVLVHVLNALRDARNVPSRLTLGPQQLHRVGDTFYAYAAFLQFLLQVAVEAVLLNEVDAVVIPEVPVEREDIWMSVL